jgi:hypothetical protein
MKSLILTVCTLALSASLSFAQATPSDILKDYQQKSAAALDRLNKTLEAQGASIAATLVGQGDAVGADELSEQIKSRIAGEAALKPHSAAIKLFRQYDSARTNALKPVQTASIAKIEALLKTSAGKKMETVLELGKARQEIESGKLSVSGEGPIISTAEDLELYLAGTTWLWSLPGEVNSKAKLQFYTDGTCQVDSFSRDKWKATSNSTIQWEDGATFQFDQTYRNFEGNCRSGPRLGKKLKSGK